MTTLLRNDKRLRLCLRWVAWDSNVLPGARPVYRARFLEPRAAGKFRFGVVLPRVPAHVVVSQTVRARRRARRSGWIGGTPISAVTRKGACYFGGSYHSKTRKGWILRQD